MRKVLHFSSPRERYICDAAVVGCYDNRFETAFRKLLKRTGIFYSDPIRVAGGAKCLASPQREEDREFVMEQVRLSMRLHATRVVVLMLHSDCGAYGGLATFKGDAVREAEHHRAELQAAARFLKNSIPELAVKAYFIDFDGIWEVDTISESKPALECRLAVK